MKLSKEEIFVREELAKIYPQLVINAKKTAGVAFNSHGLDLIAVAVEFFLLKPIEKQLESIENNKMENFITFIMAMQLKSSSSKFYNEYRKHHIKQREFYPNFDYSKYSDDHVVHLDVFTDEVDEHVQCLKCEVEKLNAFESMVFNRMLIGKETATALSREFEIPYHNFKTASENIRTKIKEKCKHLL
jgi:protoheme ferro-lyase